MVRSKPGWLGVVAVLSLIGPYATAAQVTISYDRFERTTVARLKGEDTKSQPQFHVLTTFPGDTVPAAPEAVIWFSVTGRSWQFLECHRTRLLIDGVPLEVPNEAEHDGRVLSSGGVIEFILVTVTWEHVLQLARGTTIEVKICNREFALSRVNMDRLRDFVARVTPGTVPNTIRSP